jgi:hypothetical protein
VFLGRVQNRNWNIARKRTAEGLFADDPAEDCGAQAQVSQGHPDNHDQNGSLPRKRMHKDEANDPSEEVYPLGVSILPVQAQLAHSFIAEVPGREKYT